MKEDLFLRPLQVHVKRFDIRFGKLVFNGSVFIIKTLFNWFESDSCENVLIHHFIQVHIIIALPLSFVPSSLIHLRNSLSLVTKFFNQFSDLIFIAEFQNQITSLFRLSVISNFVVVHDLLELALDFNSQTLNRFFDISPYFLVISESSFHIPLVFANLQHLWFFETVNHKWDIMFLILIKSLIILIVSVDVDLIRHNDSFNSLVDFLRSVLS